jgi:hypothetical protein
VDLALAGSSKLGGGLFEDFFAASADVDGGAELEEALGHAFAQAGAAAGDQDAFVAEKVGSEHRGLRDRVIE